MLASVHCVAVFSLLSILAVATLWLTWADLCHRRISHRPAAVFALLSIAVVTAYAVVTQNADSLIQSLVAAGTITVVAFVGALLAPGHLGGGDVKLLGILTLILAWLGWASLGIAALVWVPILALWSGVHIVRGQNKREIPLAPSLFLASWTAVVLSGAASSSLPGTTP